MKIFSELPQVGTIKKPILTTGTFDGLHIGHRTIINRLNQIAAEQGGESTLFTFFPHPRMVLFPTDHQLSLLSTQVEKQELLRKAGVQNLIVYPFSKEFSRLTALEFVREFLVNHIGIHKIVIGYDHQFGKNREGNIEMLHEYGQIFGFEVEEISPQLIDEVNVSSTKIRNALNEGRVEQANDYLGYVYSVSGIVEGGFKNGSLMGYPTANIRLADSYKLIPQVGVYAVETMLNGTTYKGMCNIGYKPTLQLDNKILSIEVHLFDFNSDIYDQHLTIFFKNRLRNEQVFRSLDELTQQLRQDEIEARKILG